MYKGIIFDMDGVLINSEHYYFKRRMTFFDSIHQKPGSNAIEDYIGKTEQQIWQLLAPDEKQKELLYPQYQAYREAHPINFMQVLNKDALPTISKLKALGKKVAIASSSPKIEIERMIQQTGMHQFLDLYISGEELNESKPHPEIYQIVSEKLGVKCLAVEDSTVGIEAAVTAGIYTLALKQSYPVNQEKANAVIYSLTEIFDYL
ncbi:HAD family hydrolase [Enterococcus sp. LJL99]